MEIYVISIHKVSVGTGGNTSAILGDQGTMLWGRGDDCPTVNTNPTVEARAELIVTTHH